jgi:hypothetical protein
MSNSLDKIIKVIEMNKLKIIYKEFNSVIKIISSFVIRKQLILYGGLVINLIVPKKDRFYKDYTVNDYDCYSINPLEDSYELSEIINKKKYKYIKIRKARHQNTYRIYVYGKQIFDITFIDAKTYDIFLEYNKKEVKRLKFYKSKYKIIPLNIVKLNLYFELSRPEQSGFRWEKIYNRLILLEKVYPQKKSKKILKCIPVLKEYTFLVKKLLAFIKVNKNPIIESFALKLYNESSKCCFRLSNDSIYITILTSNLEKDKHNIERIIKKLLKADDYSIVITKIQENESFKHSYYTIKIVNIKTNEYFNIIKIIDCNNHCFSIEKLNGYILGSVDTNLYFLYSIYAVNNIYENNEQEAEENLYYINEFNNYIKYKLKGNLEKRLKTVCYGEINYENELKAMWNKRLTVEYIN